MVGAEVGCSDDDDSGRYVTVARCGGWAAFVVTAEHVGRPATKVARPLETKEAVVPAACQTWWLPLRQRWLRVLGSDVRDQWSWDKALATAVSGCLVAPVLGIVHEGLVEVFGSVRLLLLHP